jgi:UDP-2,3-diacylglucosamine pyrophosphatase LpxH
MLGDLSYSLLVRLNRLLSLIRRKLGVSGHWSLADYAKSIVLRAVSFISDFERAVAHDVRRRGLNGVICGHIRTPAIKRIEGVTYINCGDWVDSCTAIVEHYDGRMRLVRWMHPQTESAPRAEEISESSAG